MVALGNVIGKVQTQTYLQNYTASFSHRKQTEIKMLNTLSVWFRIFYSGLHRNSNYLYLCCYFIFSPDRDTIATYKPIREIMRFHL
jgi:hypothetical protein